MKERIYKVFLVDDDIKMLIMLKHHLENRVKHDIKINIFAHGENCLDKMDLEPDLIVLDYYLNNIRENAQTGLEILRQIKQQRPNIEVIMMSAQEDMETALSTIREGAYDYVIKNEKTAQRVELLVNKVIYELKKKEQQLTWHNN